MSTILGNPITLGGGGSKVPDYTYTGNAEWYNEEKTILKLKTSGVLKLTKDCTAKVFLVGGGASGSGVTGSTNTTNCGGGGGGGGYTKTEYISFAKNTEYQAIIGAGGIGNGNTDGSDGGETSINGVSVSGGHHGTRGWTGSSQNIGAEYGAGGNGGSGGGATWAKNTESGAGGSDGANGVSVYTWSHTRNGGTGQGTTTRAFGEPDGELFAGGGGGGIMGSGSSSIVSSQTPNGGAGGGGSGARSSTGGSVVNATSGEDNTGGGGGGGNYYMEGNYINRRTPGNGGSGVILIRFA